MHTIQALATELVNFVQNHQHTTAVYDLKAQPLLDLLIEQGKTRSGCFVEYQGVFDFGHVPVCHYDSDTGKETWIAVETNGNIIEY